MLRFLADENFHGDIVDGLLRYRPQPDIVRVQDVGLRTRDDRAILRWAAERNRLLLTHDRKTIPGYAFERVGRQEPMPGVVVVSTELGVGAAIEEILVIAECSL